MAALSCNTLQAGCSPKKKRFLTSTSWSGGPSGWLFFTLSTFYGSRQWGCSQTTLQLLFTWHIRSDSFFVPQLRGAADSAWGEGQAHHLKDSVHQGHFLRGGRFPQREALGYFFRMDSSFSGLWKLWGMPLIDLFATSQNYRIQNYVSLFRAVATDAFLFNWDHFRHSQNQETFVKLQASQGIVLSFIVPFCPRKEWFPDLLLFSIDALRLLPTCKDLLRQPHFHRFHNGLLVLRFRGEISSNPLLP